MLPNYEIRLNARARVIIEMLNSKFLKNNWGKVLFCIENFCNFAV